MKTRTIVLVLTSLCICVALGSAADLSVGTWKLNEAKSKINPGDAKNTTVVYEAVGDSFKVTIDGVDGKGNPTHSGWTGKFDGKDYPAVGDPKTDTRALTKVDEHTLMLTNKKDGKVTSTGKIVFAADGKSRILTAWGTDASGKKVEDVFFYDKQ